MPDILKFFIYLFVMAGVTYLVRMIPLVLIKKKVTNRVSPAVYDNRRPTSLVLPAGAYRLSRLRLRP